MENKNQLTAAEVMQRCRTLDLKDKDGIKSGIAIWLEIGEDEFTENNYKDILDALYDKTKERFPEMEISVNYNFRENGILVLGGAKPWTESNKKCFGENNSWMEDLIELELASLPDTSNFAEFMKVIEEQELETEKIIKQMTLFRKPGDTGRLGEAMETVRGAVMGVYNQYQED